MSESIAAALVVGILQIIKQTPIADGLKKWMPLVALAIGVGISFAAGMANPAVTGIQLGLMAAGGYDVLSIKKA